VELSTSNRLEQLLIDRSTQYYVNQVECSVYKLTLAMGCVGQRKPTDAPRNFRPRLADPPRILRRSVTGKLNAILPALEEIPLPQRQSLCVCKAEVIITHARYVKKFIANLLLIDFGFNFDFDFVGPATGSGVGYPYNGSPLVVVVSIHEQNGTISYTIRTFLGHNCFPLQGRF
jgi:hypothetical protein